MSNKKVPPLSSLLSPLPASLPSSVGPVETAITKSVEPCCLVLFTRYPQAGKTKTRLIPAIGAENAARLQQRLTERIIAEYRKIANAHTSLLIHYTGANEARMRDWLCTSAGPAEKSTQAPPHTDCGFDFSLQLDGDLGERMTQGIIQAARLGASRILLVGSDIPELSASILQEAFTALSEDRTQGMAGTGETGVGRTGGTETVLGPSRDGGFYAIGMRSDLVPKLLPMLFRDVHWSTNQVFSVIRRRLALLGYPPHVLPLLQDIDTPDDLAHIEPSLLY